jgi:hypothetical protein
MDASLVLVGVTQGMVIGILGFDMVNRYLDKKARAEAKAELVETTKALAELHNKNAEAMRALQDKVSAHGMMLGRK